MKTSMKKMASLFLALVMAFALAVPAFAADTRAADGGLTLTSEGVTFDSEAAGYSYVGSDAYNAFTTYAELPDGTDLSKVTVTIKTTGTKTVISQPAGDITLTGSGTFTRVLDISSSVVTIKVTGSSGNYLHYVSAYPATFDAPVTVKIDYSNLVAFSKLSVDSYYNDKALESIEPATAAQISKAAEDVVALENAIFMDGDYPDLAGGETAMALLGKYAEELVLVIKDKGPTGDEDNGKNITTAISADDNIEYVYSIDDVNPNSCGTYLYGSTSYPAGGWMFSVERGGSEAIYPLISAAYFKLMPGDVITWSYTCDLGYDLGNGMM